MTEMTALRKCITFLYQYGEDFVCTMSCTMSLFVDVMLRHGRWAQCLAAGTATAKRNCSGVQGGVPRKHCAPVATISKSAYVLSMVCVSVCVSCDCQKSQ